MDIPRFLWSEGRERGREGGREGGRELYKGGSLSFIKNRFHGHHSIYIWVSSAQLAEKGAQNEREMNWLRMRRKEKEGERVACR